MSSFPELTERLGDGTVEVRAISGWDIPEILIAHRDDPDMHRALGHQKPPTGAQLGTQVELAGARLQAGTEIAFTIVDPGANDCRGRIELDQVDWEQGTARLSVWVAPARRGQGYAKAALQLVSAWLAQNTELRELIVTGPDGNVVYTLAVGSEG